MKLTFGKQAPEKVAKKKSKVTTGTKGVPGSVTEDERARRADAILQYASDHAGEAFSVASMTEFTGIDVGSIYREVFLLQKRGLLAKNFNQGTFIVPKTSQKEVVAKAKTKKTPKATSEVTEIKTPDAFVTQTEMLVFTFIREKRSTDLIEYLTWLEQR